VGLLRNLARDAFDEAENRKPEAKSWGLYTRDDRPGQGGDSPCGFCWFDSQAEMMHFVREYLVLTVPGLGSTDSALVLASVRGVCDDLNRRKIGPSKARAELNKVLKGLLNVMWWGTFEDLCGDGGSHPRRVRAWFRAGREVASLHAPLTESEAETLRQRLWEFGG